MDNYVFLLFFSEVKHMVPFVCANAFLEGYAIISSSYLWLNLYLKSSAGNECKKRKAEQLEINKW